MTAGCGSPPVASRWTARRVVVALAVLALVAGTVYLWRTGAVTPYTVKRWADAAIAALGAPAPALFVAVFLAGSLVGLPGMVFVIGGRLAFGPGLGLAVGFAGGMLAVLAPFLIARRLRGPGAAPWSPRQRHLARAFAMIDTHPFRAVLILRLVLWFNQPVSYGLAFTALPLRTYALASACALAPVVAVAVLATSWFL